MKNFKKLTMYDETLETTTSNSSTPKARIWEGDTSGTQKANEFYTCRWIATLENTDIESNKLIAEFMGHVYEDDTPSVELPPYHMSWDWLMPVVEKVIQEDYDFLVFEELKYQLWRVDIDAVYSAVVEFIKNQKN